MDSNHRRHSQQIYSLPHLATLVTTRCFLKANAKVVNYSDITACFPDYFEFAPIFPFKKDISTDILAPDATFLHSNERFLALAGIMAYGMNEKEKTCKICCKSLFCNVAQHFLHQNKNI